MSLSQAGVLAALAIGCAGPAAAGDPAARDVVTPPPVTVVVARGRLPVETLYFRGKHGALVRVIRGAAAPPPLPPLKGSREIVSFGTGFASEVTIVRGSAPPTTTRERRIERVSFTDSREPPVTIVRGLVSGLAPLTAADLFGPADAGELDRVAFAVDGVESRHGADLRMWRTELSGPQGPMQVSAAAAFDVGGGDRFDLRENRFLGRAYLAQMYRRYGNWPDAIAAYNWGPGSMDQWVAGGRDFNHLPPGVAWYVSRVLHDALLTAGN